jgi:hypothetical protein
MTWRLRSRGSFLYPIELTASDRIAGRRKGSAVRFARRLCAAQAVPTAAQFPDATPSQREPHVVDAAFVGATGVAVSGGTGVS